MLKQLNKKLIEFNTALLMGSAEIKEVAKP